MAVMTSTHLAHHRRFNGTEQNRSLARGLEVLRAFRPGIDLLGNGELAERTGLSRATVSRLTQTLVTCGFLEHDAMARAYRLAAPVLSLGHAMRAASPVLRLATPLMRDASMRLKANVGLASPDRTEMVYLDSIRYHQKVSLRTIVSGQRVPIERTSLGRAYLGSLVPCARRALLASLRSTHRPAAWHAIREEINAALANLDHYGACWASWQPNVVAVAAPLTAVAQPKGALVLNFSVPADHALAHAMTTVLVPELLALRDQLAQCLRQEDAAGVCVG